MSNSGTCGKQAERFLQMLQGMSEESQRSFLKIYHLAPKEKYAVSPSAYSGPHVRLAMMEALVHPEVAYWVRMNLALRVARKFSQTTGMQEKAQRISELLEAFHIASDAFVYKIPVDMAAEARLRKLNTTPNLPYPIPENAVSTISDHELAVIQEFKARVIPGLVGAIRKHRAKSA